MSISRAWNLDDGLSLVRALQPNTRKYGYHLALGGSVLNNGSSEKDIDLYFLPLNSSKYPKADPEGLANWLTKMWGSPKNIDKNYEDAPSSTPTGATGSEEGFSIPMPLGEASPTPASVDMEAPYNISGLAGLINQPPAAPPPSNPTPYRTFTIGSSRISSGSWGTIERDIFSEEYSSGLPAISGGAYKYKLQFNRKGDRIDVFVL